MATNLDFISSNPAAKSFRTRRAADDLSERRRLATEAAANRLAEEQRLSREAQAVDEAKRGVAADFYGIGMRQPQATAGAPDPAASGPGQAPQPPQAAGGAPQGGMQPASDVRQGFGRIAAQRFIKTPGAGEEAMKQPLADIARQYEIMKQTFEYAVSNPEVALPWAAENGLPVLPELEGMIRNRETSKKFATVMKQLDTMYPGAINAKKKMQALKQVIKGMADEHARQKSATAAQQPLLAAAAGLPEPVSEPVQPQERFEPVLDAQGNIIGQRSTVTGKVLKDPRTPEGPPNRLPVNFLLPDGRNVLSADGRTFLDPATGQMQPLPSDAVRVGSEGALTELRTEAAVRGARERVGEGGEGEPQSPGLSIPQAAREGTGPYANLMAAFDAVAGGVGLDALFGQEGFFQNEQEARSKLRNFSQLAKAALVNNPRFPIAEQQIVQRLLPNPDEFFTNPATETRKVEVLRTTLQEAKRANDASLASGALGPKEVAEIIASNARIDRTLQLMGPPAGEPPTISGDEDYDALPSGTVFRGPDGVLRRKP